MSSISTSTDVFPHTEYKTNSKQTPSTFSSPSSNSRRPTTTENPQHGVKETSESGGGNSAAIAVTVTLLLVALALTLGFLVYCRRKKR